ncbi:hypothetical protein [Natronomonas sp.]|uniref:hypothetical protein n=1 Tax=Natronomonas sp. TaxID=2184060 RepID=UPI00260590F7|nr:hypothetical protein [Natronomonas sp.]
MNGQRCRTIGSAWAIGQGLLSALAPGVSVAVIKRLLGTNFENADDLEAKPAYVRQLRALGIGLAAAGIAGLAMERVSGNPEDSSEPDR